ncbi:hypothetical protein HN51_067451 [Arachis hypogaea]|uniref:Peptidase A1 domain-containing protein n=1 Tax=Arachis hypogaea TaxID=3818 RepID=A0A444ZR35_ARAHY|nr:aspartic proteinase-like protein 2 [Arachis ipaensis]XP_025649620.1 aspartic proteinase-like protein 2 [Arachis hypogaea]QHO08875.1 Aspartic proteinase-like protein [Arachis hypogaea]RYR16628.1 hypothetical protein Ahy_B04g073663 [Arachis hypogaea]
MDIKGLIFVGMVLWEACCMANAKFVFPVERKFKGPVTSLSAIKNHDSLRHGRLLSAVDINLGGTGLPNSVGLYYTKIKLGTPGTDYWVQVDTGSDLLWVTCSGCSSCATRSSIKGVELNLYDPAASNTSSIVMCDDEFCNATTLPGRAPACQVSKFCPYNIQYGDGGTTAGMYVKDLLTYNLVDADLNTSFANSSVYFGCGVNQAGTLDSNGDGSLSGIMGFGQASTSVLSQLAAAGKAKKIVSHCLDTVSGGGIFAIGEVVEPKINMTNLRTGMVHYNIILKDLEVGEESLSLPLDIFGSGNGRGTVIDSGTTLAYLPSAAYEQLMKKILDKQPDLKLVTIEQQFTCFSYEGNVDDGFPIVKFHFDGISLPVYPRDYLFPFKDDMRCIGWQRSAPSKSSKDTFLLGDLVLSNKLVVYDAENMLIGWTDYNCSSSIKVKDETTGAVYTVGAHNISSASSILIGRILAFSLMILALLNNF